MLADWSSVAAFVVGTVTRVVTCRSASRQLVRFEFDVDDGRRVRRDDDIEIVHRLVEIGVVAGQNVRFANWTIERRRAGS